MLHRKTERRRGRRWLSLAAASATTGLLVARRARRDRALPSWAGRVALVTGGTRGLGFLLARELADAGCAVVICARDETELERARVALQQRGVEVLAVRCDVGDRGEVHSLVERTLARHGRIDVLVNNAGHIQVGPVETATIEDFERARRVTFDGAVHCTLAVLPHMLRRGCGNVINVSSLGGRIAVPHLVPYDAAKFALTGFSEGLRAELAPRGIRVTTVLPGTMRTGSVPSATFKGRRAAEYAWFALASTVPGLSMKAERAARTIVRGARRGAAEVVIPWYALVLTRLHGVAPGLFGALMSRLARFLPGVPTACEGDDGAAVRGREVEAGLEPPLRRVLHALTAVGRRAGRRALQPGQPEELEDLGHAGSNGRADGGLLAELVRRLPPRNVGDLERGLSGLAGGLLLWDGVARGGLRGFLAGVAGAALVGRGASGRCAIYQAAGLDGRSAPGPVDAAADAPPSFATPPAPAARSASAAPTNGHPLAPLPSGAPSPSGHEPGAVLESRAGARP